MGTETVLRLRRYCRKLGRNRARRTIHTPDEMPEPPSIRIVYYSFSAQTASLVRALARGLADGGARVEKIRLVPAAALRFPLRSIPRTVKMMFTTLLRQRVPIEPPQASGPEPVLTVLAGPTWSYNPSGPVLFFLDHYGRDWLGGRTVLPLISCRGYWRMHAAGLGRLLARCGATALAPMVVTHPVKEPWRTIGVFLKIAGRTPEKSPFLGKHYPRFGHSHAQLERMEEAGREIGRQLAAGVRPEDLSIPPRPLP